MPGQRTTRSLYERLFMPIQRQGASAVTAADACHRTRAEPPSSRPGSGRASSSSDIRLPRLGGGRQAGQGLLNRLVVKLQVLERPAQVVAVGGQVEQAVAAQGGQDDLLLAGFLA